MALVDAYNTKTGDKLPYLVPEDHIDHPVLGANLSRLPSQRAQEKPKPPKADAPKTREPIEPPASGDQTKENPNA